LLFGWYIGTVTTITRELKDVEALSKNDGRFVSKQGQGRTIFNPAAGVMWLRKGRELAHQHNRALGINNTLITDELGSRRLRLAAPRPCVLDLAINATVGTLWT
jgi:hypothetical protein